MPKKINNSEFDASEDKVSFAREELILKDCYISELRDYHIDDEILAYAITTLIGHFDKYNEGKVSQTRFNKLIYILYCELANNQININLPFFWYLYGPVVPYYYLPEGLIELRDMFRGKAIIIAEHRRYNLSEKIRDKIDYAVDDIYSMYGELDPRVMTQTIINNVYKNAPYTFQWKYREFSSQVKRKIRDKEILLRLGPLGEDQDIIRLDELIKNFDKKDFHEIYGDLLQWKLLVGYQIRHISSINGNLLKYLLDEYWSIFCQILKTKCNNNLPKPLLSKWVYRLPFDIDNYRERFINIEESFYSEIYKATGTLDDELYTAYNESVLSLCWNDNE
jgi:hypothetical protein